MIAFPNISPELFSIEVGGMTLALRWYALAYIAGLLLGWYLVLKAIRSQKLWPNGAPLTAEQLERLLTWVILGVILGGRIGYVLFYSTDRIMDDPLSIIRIWEGGMSFHGGFVGVAIAGVWFCKREKLNPLSIGDLFAYAATPGLMFGRLANFINAELWGRQTDLPWGVVFPGQAAQACGQMAGELCARHPSQLYEAALEGLLLGALIFYMIWAKGWLRFEGRVMGLFIAGYGVARFMVEFVRQPDQQFVTWDNPLGLAYHINGYGLTMGQALCIPMILVGLWFMLRAKTSATKAGLTQ